MEVLRQAGPWVPSLLSLSVCSSPSPRKGPGTYSTQGSLRLDDSSPQSGSGEARAGPRTGLHLAVTEALPGTPGAALGAAWGRSPDGHLVQRGQPGKVGMHQADGLEEAAVLHCVHLRQVGCQKRTRKSSCMAERSPHSTPKPRTTKNWGEVRPPRQECRCPAAAGTEVRVLGPPAAPDGRQHSSRHTDVQVGRRHVTDSLDAGASLKMMEKGPERDQPGTVCREHLNPVGAGLRDGKSILTTGHPHPPTHQGAGPGF